MTDYLVPALNDLAVSVAAPALLLADPDGQVRAGGVSGWFVDDVRLLDAARAVRRRQRPRAGPLRRAGRGPAGVHLRRPPARRLAARPDRHRRPAPHAGGRPAGRGGARSAAAASSRSSSRCTSTWWRTWCRCPSCGRGSGANPVAGEPTDGGLAWHHDGRGFAAAFDPAPSSVGDDGRVTWTTTVAPGSSYTVRLTLRGRGHPGVRTRRRVPVGRGRRRGAGPAAGAGGRAERRRPRRPADARRRRRVPGGRQPVVPHAVRPGLAVGRPAHDAVRDRAGALDAADAGAPAGGARRPGDRGAARQDPPRGPQHHPRARRHDAAAGLLRHRRRDVAVRVHARRRLGVGRRPGRGARAAARGPPVPGVGGRAVGVVGVAALRRRVGSRAGQPGLEGQRRLGAVRRRPAGRPADRAVRGAGLRLRGRGPGGCAAGRVRGAAGRGAAGVGGRPAASGSAATSGWTTPEGGHVAIALDARRPAGRLGDLQHGPPARHRDPRAGPGRPGRRAAERARRCPPASGCAR